MSNLVELLLEFTEDLLEKHRYDDGYVVLCHTVEVSKDE